MKDTLVTIVCVSYKEAVDSYLLERLLTCSRTRKAFKARPDGSGTNLRTNTRDFTLSFAVHKNAKEYAAFIRRFIKLKKLTVRVYNRHTRKAL